MTRLTKDDLLLLASVREQCNKVYGKYQEGKLVYFDVDESRLPTIVEHVASVTKRRYPNLHAIPPHSRLRHFIPGSVESLQRQWSEAGVDAQEQARRMVDLTLLSVLLDAGAGDRWTYRHAPEDHPVGRSEGLAIASFDMFRAGYFSSSDVVPDRVDVQQLRQLTVDRMAMGFQVTDTNPMVGLEGRSHLLTRLADVINDQVEYFPAPANEPRRPGHLVDYLLGQADHGKVSLDALWRAVMSLGAIWPARLEMDGIKLGDVWPCTCLDDAPVSFHKLSQWLTYSLVEVLEATLNLTITGTEQLTGLPEYRNGGLLIDHGLLTLKPEHAKRGMDAAASAASPLPTFDGSDPLIVEWRALTVVYMDRIHKGIQTTLGHPLTLAQVLEGGTWTAGREIAAKRRPDTGAPPITIKSDGTIF